MGWKKTVSCERAKGFIDQNREEAGVRTPGGHQKINRKCQLDAPSFPKATTAVTPRAIHQILLL